MACPLQLQLTYQEAMTALFVEGWIFLLLSFTGVRGGIVKYMPKSIAMASSGRLVGSTELSTHHVRCLVEPNRQRPPSTIAKYFYVCIPDMNP